MKYSLLFLSLCAMFYACSDEGGDEQNSPVGEQGSSSSSLLSSSSSAPFIPPCKITVLERDLFEERYDGTVLPFDAQGGIDSSLTSEADIGGIYNSFDTEEDRNECTYFLTEYSFYDTESKAKVVKEKDYCRNNYCYVPNYSGGMPAIVQADSLRLPAMKKECPWYSVTVTGKNSLLVSVDKNETGKERASEDIHINLITGCAGVSVKFSITQSAE